MVSPAKIHPQREARPLVPSPRRELIDMLTVAQLAPLKDRDPYLYETLTKVVSAVNATSQRAGVDSSTPSPAPTPIASISVQASNGWFDIAITDPSDSRPGLFYFAECDVTPAFNAPRVYFLGASRNLYVQLGNQTLYWRGFSQYIGSAAPSPRTFCSPPTALVRGGARRLTQRPAPRRQRFRHKLRRPHHKILNSVRGTARRTRLVSPHLTPFASLGRHRTVHRVLRCTTL